MSGKDCQWPTYLGEEHQGQHKEYYADASILVHPPACQRSDVCASAPSMTMLMEVGLVLSFSSMAVLPSAMVTRVITTVVIKWFVSQDLHSTNSAGGTLLRLLLPY